MIDQLVAKPQTYTILIVDDNKDSMELLGKVLIADNRKILTASSATEAFKVLDAFNIDLILLDVQMPEINGFQAAKHIRSLPQTKFTPIIFLTAIYKSRENEIKGYQSGAQDYLFKPVDGKTVCAKVDAMLHFSRIKDDLIKERDSHLQFRDIIENSDQPVCILTTPHHRFEYVNHWFENALGHTLENLQGKLFFDYFTPKERETKVKLLPPTYEKKVAVYKIKGPFRCANRAIQKIEWTILEEYGKWLCMGKAIGLPVMRYPSGKNGLT